MRALSPDFLKALRGDRLSFFFLLRLGLDTPLCFTDADHEVYYDDEKYLPVGFKFDSIQGGAGLAVDTLSINIDDTNQVMTSSLLNQDARNKWASIHMVSRRQTSKLMEKHTSDRAHLSTAVQGYYRRLGIEKQ